MSWDERQEPESTVWSDDADSRKPLREKMDQLKKKSISVLKDQGFDDDKIEFEEYLNMRYRGTESALMIPKPTPDEARDQYNGDEWAFGKAFIEQHEQEFGFTLPDRDIIIDDVRVRGIGKTFEALEKTVDQQLKEITAKDVSKDEKYFDKRQVYFDGGRRETPIYKLENLDVGDRVQGPAILADGTQTIVITPESSALVTRTHVVINIGETGAVDSGISTKEVDPIMLSIFSHRFMAIAEQMGRALQKTSVSTNVKERLDYSCALFDAEGGLVANGTLSKDFHPHAHPTRRQHFTNTQSPSSPPPPRPPRQHVHLRTTASLHLAGQTAPRRRSRLQPPHVRRDAPPRHNRHNPGLQPLRQHDPLLCRLPRPPRRHRGDPAGQHAATQP